jgi:protein O-mannosyl-transferase
MSKSPKRPVPANPASKTSSRWILLLIAAAALLPYVIALPNGFVFDDHRVIEGNPPVTGFDLHALWTKPYWPDRVGNNTYRPLTSTSFAVSWAIGHGKPAAFLALNLLLHLGATLAAWSLLRRLFPSRPGTAAAAALLFAVHPLHVEAVAGIVGRAELLAALFTLLAYRIWLDAERDRSTPLAILSAGLWFLGALSKESALALPLMLLAHRCGVLPPVSSSRRPRPVDAAWAIALAAALALRFQALSGLAAPRTWWIDNPLVLLDPARRFMGAWGVLARQLVQILTGAGLSADYSYAEVAPGPALYLAGIIPLVLVAAALTWVVKRGRSREEGWGILFFLVFWLMTSNLFVAINTVRADRLLYLPLLGLGVAAAAVVARISERPSRSNLAPAILVLAVLGFGARSVMRCRDWKSDSTLFASAVRSAPRSVKARANLALCYLSARTPESGRQALAVLEPVEKEARTFGPYWLAKAKATVLLGDRARARDLFHTGLAALADSSQTFVELGNLALIDRNGPEALRCFDALARMGRMREPAAIGRASALSVMGRYGEAAEAWLPVVATLPDSVPLRAACAKNLTDAGRSVEAARLLREGLARREDPRLEISLANAIQNGAGTPREAVDALARAARTAPSKELLMVLAVAQFRAGDRDAALATRARVSDPALLARIDAAMAATPAKP